MGKLFLSENGQEVNVGDIIKTTITMKSSYGSKQFTTFIEVNESNIKDLLEAGILIEKELGTKCLPMDLDYYIQKIAAKMNWNINKVYNYLNNIHSIYPAATFSMILREIAIEIDKKYDDHIENSPEIYVISMLDGRITKANKAHIRNYKNFAAFRSVEDAKIAYRITRDILKEMFKSGK